MERAGGHAGRILLLEGGESAVSARGPGTGGASDRGPAATEHRGDVADALAEAGFEVERTTSAAECLRQLEATELDGIVAEHAPPRVDALALLRSIRVGHPSLPFVLLPRERTDSIAGDAVAAGVSGYVSPAEDVATIVRRLASSLEGDGEPSDVVAGPEVDGHDRYRHLVEISPVPINLFDEEGTCIWGNDAVLDLLGLSSRAELVGRSIFEFVHPEDRDTARAELAEVTQERRSVGPTEMKLVPANGDVRHVRVATAIGDLFGATIGQAIVVDVSDRELRQRHLAVLDTWLRHNIRNELNLIQGFAAGIEGGRGDPGSAAGKIRAAADQLVQQADRQRRLIRLLRNPPEPMALDLGTLLERLVVDAHERYPDATVGIESTADAPVTVLPEIEDAVRELLENAIEHADAPDPTVVCSVERSAGVGSVGDDSPAEGSPGKASTGAGSSAEAILRVRDDGPGIPAAERDLLVLERDVDQIHHGSGLGLVFVYWAVRLSDGRVDFEVDDRGTTVEIRLPIDGEE
jgi:PAS domain S-box-containing protein